MANKNFGRRMVDEESITKIGQGGGGGTPIEAGTGINITGTDTKTIAVDETVVATKTDLGSYETKTDSDEKITVLEYIKSPNDYLVEDSELTNQQAVTKWIQNMPVFLGENSDNTEIAALETAGFTNILTDTLGTGSIARTKFHVFGYFIVVEENDASPRALTGVRIYASDNLGASGAIFDTKKPARRIIMRKSGGTDYCIEGARFNTVTTTLNTYVDPFNNVVTVQGFTNNIVNNALITSKASVEGGRSQESVTLYVNNPIANVNTATKIKAPTSQGTYNLQQVIDANGKFSTFQWTAATPTLHEYLVNFEFAKTGTGAANYSVYFNLKSGTEYDPQNIDFTTLRNLIIANGNNVQCSCQTAGTLDMNIVSTSTNAGDDTILVDSKTSDFFEFYSLSELTNYSITKLNY